MMSELWSRLLMGWKKRKKNPSRAASSTRALSFIARDAESPRRTSKAVTYHRRRLSCTSMPSRDTRRHALQPIGRTTPHIKVAQGGRRLGFHPRCSLIFSQPTNSSLAAGKDYPCPANESKRAHAHTQSELMALTWLGT